MFGTKSIIKGMVVILMAVLAFGCSTTKSITKQARENLKPDSNFKIALWAERKDKTYELGEDIYLFFAANKDCNLKLIHISSIGEERVLLPNKYQQDSLAKAGYVYQIPSKKASFTFKAREPVCEGIIKAVATLDNTMHGQKDVKEEYRKTTHESVTSKKQAEYQITIKTVKKRP